MTLGEWAAAVDEKLITAVPAFRNALRGKGATDPLGRRLLGSLAFEQPFWSGDGFVSAWPSPWNSDRAAVDAHVLFFDYVPDTLDGTLYAERLYSLTSSGADEAALDVASFLAPGHLGWRHPANLRERRRECDTFAMDLIHEFGHAVVGELKEATVLKIVIQGIEVYGDAVNVTVGGHVDRWTGSRQDQIWGEAVTAVSGLVAERLHADRDATFEDPIGLLLSDPNYYSDLEGAMSAIIRSRQNSILTGCPTVVSLHDKRKLVHAAVEQAVAVIPSRLNAIESEAARWKRRILEAPCSELLIRWQDQRGAFFRDNCCRPRRAL